MLGDVLVFTGLFSLYLIDRGDAEGEFVSSQAELNGGLATVNTVILLTSSLAINRATRRFRAGDLARARTLLRVTMLLGACFIGLKAIEYHALITDDHTATSNDFFMWYFVLTGLHLAHVGVGLLLLSGLHWMTRHPYEPHQDRVVLFEAGGSFWHMVDLLWIIIFPLIFFVR